MSYSEDFSIQWDNFVSEFISSIKGYSVEMISLDKINRWYKSNSFRWNSISEKEGILLEKENNSELKKELLEEISKFSFNEVKISSKPNALPYVGSGVLATIVVGVVSRMIFHTNLFLLILECFAALFAFLIIYAKKLDNYKVNQWKMIQEGYGNQLILYKKKLIDICKKFE